jgi:hypothetical protein
MHDDHMYSSVTLQQTELLATLTWQEWRSVHTAPLAASRGAAASLVMRHPLLQVHRTH